MDWNTIALAALGSTSLSTIIVKLLDMINNRKKKNDESQINRDIILVAMAGRELIGIIEKAIEVDGYMDLETRRHCEKLFKAYVALGGNGIVKRLWEQCQSLPLEPPK